MSSSLKTAQDAIVATLTGLLDVTVLAHGGRFVERELPMLLAKAPCVLIAPLSVTSWTPSSPGEWSALVTWGAYCLGADGSGNRAEQAMELAEQVLDQLVQQQWGLTDAVSDEPEPGSPRADNLYTGHVNNLRVALWATSWTQTLIRTIPDP